MTQPDFEPHSDRIGSTDVTLAEKRLERIIPSPSTKTSAEVVTVPIGALLPGESPRSEGQSGEHVSRLADTEGPLPPILVNRRTMQVIDGTHRLLAAFLKGQETVEAIFLDGSPDEAFLWSVQANVTHGLPLSQADRRSAAARIIWSHPHLSDRAIARVSGLGARTVAALRRSSETGQPAPRRVGRDGRVRPVNGTEGRLRVAEIMAERPEASLREVARLAGVSPATASDVRQRLAAGESPALETPTGSEPDDAVPGAGLARLDRPRRERPSRVIPRDPEYVLRTLVKDPSLRHKEEGRELLRLLQHNAIGTQELPDLTDAVPEHCGTLIADIAKQYAQTWLEFASELDRRIG